MTAPQTDLSALRLDYQQAVLDERSIERNPFALFARWFDEAAAAGMYEPNAMTLATIDPDGNPSARIVLLKACDERGFVFYTNQLSRKARALGAHPRAALLFYWPELERQVRLEGAIEVVDDATADAYFESRPRLSRVGAWASPQSEPLADREALLARFAEVERRFAGASVPRPPHWGGYRLLPYAFEYWQGRRSRLHDRVRFQADGEGWRIDRIAP